METHGVALFTELPVEYFSSMLWNSEINLLKLKNKIVILAENYVQYGRYSENLQCPFKKWHEESQYNQWFGSPFKINAMRLLVIHKSNENIKDFEFF